MRRSLLVDLLTTHRMGTSFKQNLTLCVLFNLKKDGEAFDHFIHTYFTQIGFNTSPAPAKNASVKFVSMLS